MRQFTPRQLMVPLVIGLTAVHVALRVSARDVGQPLHVSELQPGAQISLTPLADRAAPLAGGTCLQVVVFSPDCPFCQRAADRESEVLAAESQAKRLWYTDGETATLPYFVSEHLHRDPGISAELVKELKVQAVPALFVLSPRGEVRWVGSYEGDESDQELSDRCTNSQAQRT